MNENAICLAVDEKYLKYFRFVEHQLRDCAIPKFVISEKKVESETFTWIDPSNFIRDFDLTRTHAGRSNLPKTSLFRLYIPICSDLKAFKKVAYLDCDLVLRPGWEELFNVKTRTLFTGAIDVNIPQNRSFLCSILRLSPWYLYKTPVYINTGVLLVNMTYASEEYSIRLREMIDADFDRGFLYRDQDIINAGFENGSDLSPQIYNCFSHLATSESKIIHYTASENAKMLLDALIEKECSK